MSRNFLIALLFSVPVVSTFAEPSPVPRPSVSPSASPTAPNRLVDQVSAEEKKKAEDLWNRAMEKFASRSYRESSKLLRTYVDRYPATPEALEARYVLAQSLLFAKDAKASIPVFISVIEIRGRSPIGNEARLYLGQAYLDETKFTEAFLVSEELLKQDELGTTFRAKALLLRAHAQAGMKQNAEAEKTLVAFQVIAEEDPELERETAGSFLISLLLKGNRCDALPSGKALPEDQLLDQTARKSICVLEMGTLLAKASKRLSEKEIEAASETFLHSLESYRQTCKNPPLAAGKLGKEKLAVAKKELSERLGEGRESAEKLLTETFKDREALKKTLSQMKSSS